jgi:hypothetical protein
LEVRPASFRKLRGPTYVAVVADELAFWYVDAAYANPDVEILNAVEPGLATTGGPLILASSPHARRGAVARPRRLRPVEGSNVVGQDQDISGWEAPGRVRRLWGEQTGRAWPCLLVLLVSLGYRREFGAGHFVRVQDLSRPAAGRCQVGAQGTDARLR